MLKQSTLVKRIFFLTMITAWFTLFMLSPKAYSNASPSVETPEPKLSEEQFEHFKANWIKDSGFLVKNNALMSRLGSEQITEIVELKDTTQYSFMHIVSMKGEDLGDNILGKPLSNLSVMIVQDDQLIAIPFQFDETDVNGLIYMPKGHPYKIFGQKNTLDTEDELLVLYRDAGFERFNAAKHSEMQGQVLKELHLTYPDHKDRFAYLVENNPERSDVSYVHLDIKEGFFESTFLKMKWNPKNIAMIKSIIPKIGALQGKNMFDNYYAEVSVGLFSKNIRVSLNSNKHITSKISAIKSGPIRVTALLKARAKILSIPSPAPYYLNMSYGEQSFSFRSRSTPDGYSYSKYLMSIIKEPEIKVSVDFHNVKGAQVSFDSIYDPNSLPIVDGKMSPIEEEINRRRLPGKWLWINSNQSWNVFLSNRLAIVEEGLFDVFLEGINSHFIYEDDPESYTKFERYPGAEPRFGITMRGLPSILFEILDATKDLPWEQDSSINRMGDFISAPANASKLVKLNKVIARILVQEREKGKINNNAELADAFIADFDLVGIKGINRSKLNEAIHFGIGKIDSFENFELGAVIRNVRAAATDRGINIADIRYSARDSAVLLVNSIDKNGPDAFNAEVNNPPQLTLKDI